MFKCKYLVLIAKEKVKCKLQTVHLVPDKKLLKEKNLLMYLLKKECQKTMKLDMINKENSILN